MSSITNFIDRGIEKKEFYSHKSSKAVALYIISFFDGLMLDTFNLGMDITEVNEQIDVVIFTLENILCPIK